MAFISIVAAGMGTLMTAGGFAWSRWVERMKERHQELVRRRTIVDGVIAENRGDGDGYNAVISYSVGGTEYRIVGDDDGYVPWTIGKVIAVAYDPAQPSHAVEVEYDDSWDQKLALGLRLGGLVIIGLASIGLMD